eukprot:jgi/Bigna1/127765/aug1.5_g2473
MAVPFSQYLNKKRHFSTHVSKAGSQGEGGGHRSALGGARGGTLLSEIRKRLPEEVLESLEAVSLDLSKKTRIERLAKAIETGVGENELLIMAAELQIRVPKSEAVNKRSVSKAIAKCWYAGIKDQIEKHRQQQLVQQDSNGIPQEQGEDEEEVLGHDFDADAFFESLSLDEKLDALVETSPTGLNYAEGTKTMSSSSAILPKERALLVGVDTYEARSRGGYSLEESLLELERLAESAGLRVVASASQKYEE